MQANDWEYFHEAASQERMGSDRKIFASAGAMPPPGRTQGPPLQSGVARARPYTFIYGIASIFTKHRCQNYVGRARGPARTHSHTASPAFSRSADARMGRIGSQDFCFGGGDAPAGADARARPYTFTEPHRKNSPGRTPSPARLTRPAPTGSLEAHPYRFICGIARTHVGSFR